MWISSNCDLIYETKITRFQIVTYLLNQAALIGIFGYLGSWNIKCASGQIIRFIFNEITVFELRDWNSHQMYLIIITHLAK
jgi:hypothetical protein